MSMSGRSIKLFLVDGSPSGLITAEIGQWTGKAIVAPRQHLEKLVKREEAQRTGVYILSGPDPERDGVERVYIGEGEGVISRIKSHDQNKDFWKRVCIFTAADENLTKSHIKYLESRLVEMTKAAGRAVLDNGNVPARSGLPESEQADMETFLDQMRILLPVLGFHLLEPSAAKKLAENPEAGSPVFEINGVGVKAIAQEIEGEFVVRKGSTARLEGVPSWTAGKSTRDRLVKEGVLQISPSNPEHYAFMDDYAFTSPSLAAATVLARNTNGRIEWKVKSDGKTYAQWQEGEGQGS